MSLSVTPAANDSEVEALRLELGRLKLRAEEEKQRAQAAEKRAEEEKLRTQAAEKRAEKEKLRADRLGQCSLALFHLPPSLPRKLLAVRACTIASFDPPPPPSPQSCETICKPNGQ